VQVALGAKQLPLRFERRDDVLVRILHAATGEVSDPLVEAAAVVDRVLELDPVFLAEAKVVLAEGDCGVDEPSAFVGGDEVGEEDRVAARAVVGDVVEGRLIGRPGEGLAREVRKHLRLLAEGMLDPVPCQHVNLAAEPRPHVLDLGSRGDRRVRDQRPGRGGPDEQLVARLEWRLRDRIARCRVEHRELHVDGWVLDVAIAEGDLVRGERGAVPRAVGHDLVVLIEATVVPDPPQRPPDRLDVGVGHRHVGVVEVDPEADSLGEAVPLLDVAEDRFAAALVELGDSVVLDLLLGGDPELALDLELDREPVRVPARFTRDPFAGHRPEPRIDVLEDAG
jgi:hypothetical protein